MNIKKITALLLAISLLLSTAVSVSAATESNTPVSLGKKILFSENFNSGIAKWKSNNDDSFTGNAGKLVYKNVLGNSFEDYINNEEITVSNGYVQFDMKAYSPVGFAVKVREKGDTAILVSFDYSLNKVRITRTLGGGKNVFLNEGSFKLSDGITYSVNIGLSGNDIAVKINNAEIVKATASEVSEGSIGFAAKKGRYEIDNLLVYQLDGESYKELITTNKTTKIYVAPDGNDETGDGSYEKPFATIEKAKEMTFRAKESYLPIEVIFKEGEYRIKEVTVFDQTSSGTEYAPITYRADDGAKVEFNGATVIDHTKFKPITDESIRNRLYEHVQDKVLQLELAEQGFTKEDLDFVSINKELPPEGVLGRDERKVLETINFFLNDRKQQISRWPNSGFATLKKVERGSIKASDPYTGGRIFFADNAPLRWTEAKDAYVEGLMYYEWYNESIPIKEINLEDFSIDLYRYSNCGLRKDHEYCVKNLLEEIDRPGEWYVDFDTMILYYYPERAFKEDDIFEVSTLKQAFITLTNASYLNFKDITFKNSAGLIQTVYDEEGKYIDFGIYFHDNWIKDFGGGIEIDYQTHDVIIDGCTFKDINGTGIRSVGWKSGQTFKDVKNIYIQNNNFYRCTNSAIRIGTGLADTLVNGNFNVTNNFFYENDIVAANAKTCGFTIKNNLHMKVFGHAIRCQGAEYIVENNEISYGSYGQSDMGTIYSGRNMMEHGSSISRNLITNYGPAPVEPRSFPAGAIYLDDAVGGITLTQNMSNARSKNYQSTGLIYGYGPDIEYYGNISLDASRGFILQNRSGSTAVPLALNQPRSRFNNGKEIWINKYPQVERMLEWLADNSIYDPQIQFYDNLSTNNDVSTHKTNFDKTPYVTGRIEDAHIIEDTSIYVDPVNYDYRLKMEAVEKYNLPSTLPNEENLDIDSIGLQRELKFNQELVDFDITYPVNGEIIPFASKAQVSWQTSDAAINYEYTVATDKEFKHIVANGTTMDNYVEINNLKPESTYYVKVKAISVSRKFGYEIENKNGIIQFTTSDKESSSTTLLEVAVKKLEEKIKEIKEGNEKGKAKPGTTAKGKALVQEAYNTIAAKPSQEQVDKICSDVLLFVDNVTAYYNTGYAKIGINKQNEWLTDAGLESVTTEGNTVTFKTSEANATSVALNKITPNTDVLKFSYSISSFDSWHAIGLRRQNSTVPIYVDDSYYIVIKKDLFELQKTGTIIDTKENNGIVEVGKENEVTFGAVGVEGGINIYLEINGTVVFDYLDTDELLAREGMFGIHIPNNATMTITDNADIPTEFFTPSANILDEIMYGKKTVYNTDDEGFKVVKGTFNESANTNNSDSSKELIGMDAGAEAIWTMTAKGDTTYEIFYYHRPADGNDNAVEVIITGKDGTYRTKVDMTAGEEGYKSLGTFKFTSDNAAIGMTSVIFRGSGNGKMPISTVYIRETTSDKPDMLKPENQK